MNPKWIPYPPVPIESQEEIQIRYRNAQESRKKKEERETQERNMLVSIFDKTKYSAKGFATSLTKEEILFLYTAPEPTSFYRRDGAIISEVKKIAEKRNVKADLAFALDVEERCIATTQEEALGLQGECVWYEGNMLLGDVVAAEHLILPRYIKGSLDLKSLRTAENLVLPRKIGLNLDIQSIESLEGVVWDIENIGGSIMLSALKTIENITFQECIRGDLVLEDLVSARHCILPKYIGGQGSLYLSALVCAENVVFPQYIGNHFVVRHLPLNKFPLLPEGLMGKVELGRRTQEEIDEIIVLVNRYPGKNFRWESKEKGNF